ncbi:leucine-rich repeat-containing protein 25 [Pyxicephalus adspersus]|uniref:leucine-rich repeat-containing protein 25 n=1 Tax=Pyxicephalus adspersus TaxID=30357 RepID=UPI003B5A6D10
MWMLMLAVSFFYTFSDAKEVCNGTKCETLVNGICEPLHWSNFESCENVNLSNNNIVTIIPTSNYKLLEKLDLSHNRLAHLPEKFLSTAIALKEINLGNNILEELPENFLSNSSKLQMLKLEGNRITKIPTSVFHSSLLNLSVDCTCDLARSIVQQLNTNSTDQSKPFVICTTSSITSKFEKVEEFFARNCGSQSFLVLYIVLPTVALGVIVGGVALYLWKKNNSSANIVSKTSTEKSPSHGQPRYMTRNMDVAASTLNQNPGQNYENVFVGHFQTNKTKPHEYLTEQSRSGAPIEPTMEEDIYLESDVNEGDQPIYSNTQGVYYNYCDHGNIHINKEEDDVYILPDQ